MCAFSYACSLPVMRQRWYLQHSIRRNLPKKPHANITALCLIQQELSPSKVLHCGNRNFAPFWLVWPWPWPDDRLHLQTGPVFPGDIPHVQIWISYVKAFDRQSGVYVCLDRQTYTHRHDQNYLPWVAKNCKWFSWTSCACRTIFIVHPQCLLCVHTWWCPLSVNGHKAELLHFKLIPKLADKVQPTILRTADTSTQSHRDVQPHLLTAAIHIINPL